MLRSYTDIVTRRLRVAEMHQLLTESGLTDHPLLTAPRGKSSMLKLWFERVNESPTQTFIDLVARRLTYAEIHALLVEAGNDVDTQRVKGTMILRLHELMKPSPPRSTEEENCPVCFEPVIAAERFAGSPCHAIHDACAKGWIASTTGNVPCPICRKTIAHGTASTRAPPIQRTVLTAERVAAEAAMQRDLYSIVRAFGNSQTVRAVIYSISHTTEAWVLSRSVDVETWQAILECQIQDASTMIPGLLDVTQNLISNVTTYVQTRTGLVT